MGYEPLYDALQYGKRTSDFLGRFYFYFILFYFILFYFSLLCFWSVLLKHLFNSHLLDVR